MLTLTRHLSENTFEVVQNISNVVLTLTERLKSTIYKGTETALFGAVSADEEIALPARLRAIRNKLFHV